MEESVQRRAVRRLIFAVGSLSLLLLVGTVGYALIEGMSWIDALYMVVITVSTVGFGEISPLTPAGRLFTIGLIGSGAGLVAFTLSGAAEFILSGEWQEYLEQRRRIRMVDQLRNHTIICGYGRIGRHVADELHAQGLPFVVLDLDMARVERVRHRGYLAIQGNAANEEELQAAGIERAGSIVATANSDAENVFIVLTARSMRPDMVIVARANFDESEDKLLRAGATRVILPYRICGRRMAALISRPGVADFLDEVMHASGLELLIDQVMLDAKSPLAGQTLGSANLRSRLGVTVLAVGRPSERVDISPGVNTVLAPGSMLIVLGTRDQLQSLAALAREG
ncbi:potassium channel protein [Chloroflexales bacterium ZM16-3]|nr:potassium channel protein [Chloroflexales bacterium ZM16-3]